jgi:hypothetical protein
LKTQEEYDFKLNQMLTLSPMLVSTSLVASKPVLAKEVGAASPVVTLPLPWEYQAVVKEK